MSNDIPHIHPEEIGFDFDGVIADTATSFVNIAKKKHNFSISVADIIDFDVENCIDIPRETVYQIFIEIMKDSLATEVLPMQGAMETLQLMATSHRVTVITARPEIRPVELWLQYYLDTDNLRNISLVAMGNHDDKVRYAREHKLKYFVDDRLETCLQFSEAGFHPFVFDQPWNQGRHTLPTVFNWQDICALLKFT